MRAKRDVLLILLSEQQIANQLKLTETGVPMPPHELRRVSSENTAQPN
jgi:hypothetical protein